MMWIKNGEYHQIGGSFTPDIEAIAYSLSYLNRFTGHVGQYSVAQHCCLVASVLPLEYKLSGLLHDASEAYLGDVSRPVKRLIYGYQELENKYLNIIDEYFNVSTTCAQVKEADQRMLVTEGKSFGVDIHDGFWPSAVPYDFTIERWPPEQACSTFLQMFKELTR